MAKHLHVISLAPNQTRQAPTRQAITLKGSTSNMQPICTSNSTEASESRRGQDRRTPARCISLGHGQEIRSKCPKTTSIGGSPREHHHGLMLTQPPKNPETGPQCVTRRLVSRSPSRACRVALDRFRHAAGPRDHLKGHPVTPRTMGV